MIEFTKKFLAKYMHKILFGIVVFVSIGITEKFFNDKFFHVAGALAILSGVWGTIVGQTFWASEGVKPAGWQTYNIISIVAGLLIILLGLFVF